MSTNCSFLSSKLVIVASGHIDHVRLIVTAFCSFAAIHDMAVVVAVAPVAMK